MNPRDRRIRRLHLVSDREEHARRGSTLLEDALRTASLADEGRVVFIRSLHLGRLSPHTSSMEWSRRIEQRVRAAMADAVSAEAPNAELAEAVWFSDAFEPWISLASRVARGVVCTGWFWRPAVPGWGPHLDAPATMRLAFQRLATIGGAPATLALARRLAYDGGLLSLLRALSQDDVRGLLGATQSEDSVTKARLLNLPGVDTWSKPSHEPRWPAGWRSIMTQLMTEVQADDVRLVWLAAAALSTHSMIVPSIREAQLLAARTYAAEAARAPHFGEATGSFGSEGRSESIEVGKYETISVQRATHRRRADPLGNSTGCGGLFFLIRLFERLGIADWPRASAAAWPALSLVLQHCRPAAHDVLPRLLSETCVPDNDATPVAFALGSWPEVERAARVEPAHGLEYSRLVARWRSEWRVLLDASGRLPLAAWPRGARAIDRPRVAPRQTRRTTAFPASLQPRVVALALGAHRLSRRMTGLSVKALVRRPARITLTETHVEVFFRPMDADTRIRRVALDVDPGWVPWLGRSVSFHYTRADT